MSDVAFIKQVLKIFGNPDSPENHDSPENPDSPENHDSPENPDSPQNPEIFGNPTRLDLEFPTLSSSRTPLVRTQLGA